MDTIKLRPVGLTDTDRRAMRFMRLAFIAGVPVAHIADVLNAAKIPEPHDPEWTPARWLDGRRKWTEDFIKHMIRKTTLREEEEILGLPPTSMLVNWHGGRRVTGLSAFHEPWAGAPSGEDHEAHDAAVAELMADGTSKETVMERVYEEVFKRSDQVLKARADFGDTFDLQVALDAIVIEASDDDQE